MIDLNQCRVCGKPIADGQMAYCSREHLEQDGEEQLVQEEEAQRECEVMANRRVHVQ